MSEPDGMSEPDEPESGAPISLREVTKETLGTILRLKVAPGQEHFVASNAASIAQAHFHEEAWFRAVYAGEVPVGFVMLEVNESVPEYGVWRFMIGARHQGKGFGRDAMARIVEHVRSLPGAKELLLSHVPGEGSPGQFYVGLGYEYTGEEDHGELIMRLALE